MARDVVAIGLASVTLAVTGYVAMVVGTGQSSREAELEEALAAANARLDNVAKIERQVAGLSKRLDRRIERMERSTAELAEAAVAAGVPSVADAAMGAEGAMSASGVPLEDAIASRIEAKLGERMEKLANRERNGQGEWKAPIDELAGELGLNDDQKQSATQIFNEARDETFVLLRTQRLDGGSLLDDFAAALKNGGDAPGATRQFFQRIFTEKVPGTDRTFLNDLISLRTDVQTALSNELEEGQMKKLGSLRVDLLDVKTGHDPIKDYIEARVQ
jgi:hypothetical protein